MAELTVLLEPGQEDLVEFLKDNQVKVVASLPCYGEANVDAQRGILIIVLTAACRAFFETKHGHYSLVTYPLHQAGVFLKDR